MTSARLALLFCAILGALSQGCASDYVARTRPVREAYEAYDHEGALAKLTSREKEFAEIDQLLLLLDKGMVLHAAGRWQESIQVLAQADKLSAQLDFTSVSEEAAIALTNERQRVYRGEDFEKLMISTLQALNYLQLGLDEDALVEVRRVNERLRKMVADEKKPYEQLAIARYLGGVLYEDEGNKDSAFIDYQEALKLNPSLGSLAAPVIRLARETGRHDAAAELSTRYPDAVAEGAPLGPDEGQVVVVTEMGIAPEKRGENRGNGVELVTVPVFRGRGGARRADVAVAGQQKTAVTVTNLASVAVLHLEDRIGKLVAKQIAAVVAKGGVAVAAGALTRSEEVGALTFLLLNAFNQPDLRSWLSLPAEFQVARFRVPAGEHQVEVRGDGRVTLHKVDVKKGRVSVVVVRRY